MVIVDGREIQAPIKTILEDVRELTSLANDTYLRQIKESTHFLMVTCPFHKDHNERRPSCGVFLEDKQNFKAGDFHCFTCGAAGNLSKLVGKCLKGTEETGRQWLLNNYSDVLAQRPFYLPKIELSKSNASIPYLDEALVQKYGGYHPYLKSRNISEDIAKKFQLGYNKETDSVIFPLRDAKGGLVGLSSRNVKEKLFNIDIISYPKPVYLLDTVIREGYTSAIICESQIDALTAWSYGYVACAMIGTGSREQYDILNKSPLRHYVLMFDNDEAGKNAKLKFIHNIRKDVFVTPVKFPEGKKDINDFSKEEFDFLLNKEGLDLQLRIK